MKSNDCLRTIFEIGRLIVENEQQGETRAAYGKGLLKELSQRLTTRFGKGFSVDNLENMRRFYQTYGSSISETASRIFKNGISETASRILQSGESSTKLTKTGGSSWLEEGELPVHLDGLSLDAVYENFVRQIAGTALGSDESATLKESVEQQKQREQLEKQIAALEAKIRKEKQPKKKFELVSELKQLQEDARMMGGH